jgi:hypothetical protein
MMATIEPDTQDVTRQPSYPVMYHEDGKPAQLDYQSGQPGGGRCRRGVSLPGRILFAAFCILFTVSAWGIWRMTSRGSFDNRDLLQPSVLLSVAASVLCFFVAIGLVGRRVEGSR